MRVRCSQAGPGSRYVAFAAVALAALAALAGLAAVAARPVANVLRDNITFTRKDFVPYSERRRCALAVSLPPKPRASLLRCAAQDVPCIRLELEAEDRQATEAASRLSRQQSAGGGLASPAGAGGASDEQSVKDLLKLLPN